jgi:hypothetical protein
MALGLTQNLTVKLSPLASSFGGTALCRNTSTLEIQACSASSLRYKTDVRDYTGGLPLVERMRPISFAWKAASMSSMTMRGGGESARSHSARGGSGVMT